MDGILDRTWLVLTLGFGAVAGRGLPKVIQLIIFDIYKWLTLPYTG